MTEIFAQPDATEPLRASELHGSLSERLSAQVGEAAFGTMRAITRNVEYATARGEGWPGLNMPEDPSIEDIEGLAKYRAETPDVPIADAKLRVKQEGLEGHLKLPDQSTIKQPVLDLMIAHGHERRQYEAAVNRGPQGFLSGALGFITEIGAGLIDPLSIAAFSVPVIGEARLGMLMAKAGESGLARGGVRAGVGAAQGALGGAALVPNEWWLHTNDGLDYTMADALRSIALSAGMGGTFHAGVGALGDVLARRRGLPLPGSPADIAARRAALLEAPEIIRGTANATPPPGTSREDAVRLGYIADLNAPAGAHSTHADIEGQLRAAGMSADEAAANAAIVSAHYATRAERLGQDPFALYRSEGIEVGAGEEGGPPNVVDRARLAAARAMIAAEKVGLTDPDTAWLPAHWAAKVFMQGERTGDLFAQREAAGQTEIPGTERIGQGEQAQRKANAPLKPKAAQKPADEGLFSDQAAQKSFFQSGRLDEGQLEMFKNWANELPAGEAASMRAAPPFSNLGMVMDMIRAGKSDVEINAALAAERTERSARRAAVALKFHRSFSQQGATGPRGRVMLGDSRAVVELFKTADQSTFMHEMGHLWLDELVRDAARENVPQALKDDLGTILRWLGVDKAEDLTREHHEQWARGFEQYLAEGKAPSSGLAKAFAAFKDWLAKLYRSLTELGTPISDDIRGVMDRMLASDKEIADARSAPPHPAEILTDLPGRVREDTTRAAVADVIQGNAVRVGEMLEEAGRSDPRIAESFDAYHGSPHDFESFDISRIGTGEGAQSYGHGLYFAENPSVAETYNKPQTGGGMGFVGKSSDLPTGRMYRVRILADKEHFLDWDKPLSEQSEFVKDALETLKREYPTTYEGIAEEFPSHLGQRYAADYSRVLREAGIPGIKYLDQGSRSVDFVVPDSERVPNDQTHNIVLFDDKLVEITHKNGAPVSRGERQELLREKKDNPGADVLVGPRAARGPRARDPETWSLLEFLAANGGIRNDDPLISDIGQNKFIPGFGPLIRPPKQLSTAARRQGQRAPMTLDMAREAAVEAGYIFDIGHVTDAEATSTVNTLLRAIDDELRGNRVYREGRIPEPSKAEKAEHLARLREEADGEFEAALTEAGGEVARVPDKTRQRVLEIMTREGERDPLLAYERAVMEETEHGAQTGEHERLSDEIPGWDIPADADAAPGTSRTVAAGGEGNAGRTARDAGDGDRGAPDWNRVADAKRGLDDDLIDTAREAERTPEPESVEPARAPSAAEKAAAEADKLLDDILPKLTDEERELFQSALDQVAADKEAHDTILRDGAACLAMAAV